VAVPLRALLVDDNQSFLVSVARLLRSQGVDVVGSATTLAATREALNALADALPDVILVDVDLGQESGFEVVREVARSWPTIAAVLVSTHAEEELGDLIQESSAAGFLPKAGIGARALRSILGQR
jgi:DNA-binding NarL/FixJ family response regulator